MNSGFLCTKIKPGQLLTVGNVVFIVREVEGSTVKIAIKAPKDLKIKVDNPLTK